jgi:hypothetical protein
LILTFSGIDTVLLVPNKLPKIPNKLTRLEACRHLRVSETKFNMLRRKGLISEGTKKAGDVRKWSIEELDKYIKNNS